jgi:hypothetical protein
MTIETLFGHGQALHAIWRNAMGQPATLVAFRQEFQEREARQRNKTPWVFPISVRWSGTPARPWAD